MGISSELLGSSQKQSTVPTRAVTGSGISAQLFSGPSSTPVVKAPPAPIPSSPYNPIIDNPFLKNVGKVADVVENLAKNVPRIDLSKPTKTYTTNKFQPVGFVSDIVQGVINTPAEAFAGAASLGEHIGRGDSSPRQVLGDVAAAAQLPLLFLTGGSSSVAKQGLAPTIKAIGSGGAKGLIKTAVRETKIGAGFGVLAGFQSGENIDNVSDYIKNLLGNISIGAGIGLTTTAVVQAVIPLAKGLDSKFGGIFIKNANTEKPVIDHIQMSPKVAQETVLANNLENTPVGKAILKESFIAQKTDDHVAITPNVKGQYDMPNGGKVDVNTVEYQPAAFKITEETSPGAISKELLESDKSSLSPELQSLAQEARVKAGKVLQLMGNDLEDISIIGSTARGKLNPNDLDILITPKNSFGELTNDKLYDRIALQKVFTDELQPIFPDKKLHITISSYDATRGPKMSLEEFNPLIQEARKYKSAEEFVKAQPTYYRGEGGSDVAQGKALMAEGRHFAMDSEYPKRFGDVKEYVAKPNAKVFDASGLDYPEMRSKLGLPDVGMFGYIPKSEFTKALKEKGYDILKYEGTYTSTGKSFVHTVEITPDSLIPKSQLTDIFNQATRKIDNTPGSGTIKTDGTKETSSQGQVDQPNIREDQGSQTSKGLQEPQVKTNEGSQNQPNQDKASQAILKDKNREPIGTGQPKNSRLYQRVKETLGAEYESRNVTYNTLNLEKQAEQVVKTINDNPSKALRIARGLEEPPLGTTQNAFSIGMAETALRQGDIKTAASLWTKASLRSTRSGQEIVSLRGSMTGDNPSNIVKGVVDARLEQIADKYKSLIQNLDIPQNKSKPAKALEVIKDQTKKAVDDIKVREARIKSIHDVIDAITCK